MAIELVDVYKAMRQLHDEGLVLQSENRELKKRIAELEAEVKRLEPKKKLEK